MKKNILILGASGFVGKNLVNFLKHKYNITFVSGKNEIDLRKTNSLNKFYKKKIDYCINCAAHVGSVHYVRKNSTKILYDNILITTNIYRFIANKTPKTKILNIIANCFYPDSKKFHKENEWNNKEPHESVAGFAYSRRFLINLSEDYKKKYNIHSINIVCPSLFGPGDSIDPNRTHALNGLIIRIIKSINNKDKNFEIWGSGKQIREWIFIYDLIKLIDLIIMKNIYHLSLMNFSQKKFYSINFLVKNIKKIINSKIKVVHNMKLNNASSTRKVDNNKFLKKFSNFQFTNLENGIAETIKYYKKRLFNY
jgi:GDP-L-fucose synthase